MSADESAVPESWGSPRSKTITWYDPRVTAEAGAQMSGLDHLRAMAAGELPPPPIAELFGMRFHSAEKGEVVFVCTPDESAYNPIGLIHGGLVCTLLDTVAGCAVQSTLPVGTGYTSIEIKVNYLRPVHSGAELRAHGWVTKPGRRVAFAEGDVRSADGKVLATASSTCLILGG
ncbi:PaaI family thioesterase [Streptomyces sp. NBC_01803]|uniref:PaaI family thioesterase n=1 Tax=Streptomyces sp. NBC_01803 TaxID=2975946 RepID=UPI002DD98AF3|nr:PaaI family thioesterase [Streptomyces sp. NBC_01803]WSA43601.1 PaaI family thioesterase [Streptomyces sp. NBC_01803]